MSIRLLVALPYMYQKSNNGLRVEIKELIKKTSSSRINCQAAWYKHATATWRYVGGLLVAVS